MLRAYWIIFNGPYGLILRLFLLLKIQTTSALEILWAVSLKALVDGGSKNKKMPYEMKNVTKKKVAVLDKHFVHRW